MLNLRRLLIPQRSSKNTKLRDDLTIVDLTRAQDFVFEIRRYDKLHENISTPSILGGWAKEMGIFSLVWELLLPPPSRCGLSTNRSGVANAASRALQSRRASCPLGEVLTKVACQSWSNRAGSVSGMNWRITGRNHFRICSILLEPEIWVSSDGHLDRICLIRGKRAHPTRSRRGSRWERNLSGSKQVRSRHRRQCEPSV